MWVRAIIAVLALVAVTRWGHAAPSSAPAPSSPPAAAATGEPTSTASQGALPAASASAAPAASSSQASAGASQTPAASASQSSSQASKAPGPAAGASKAPAAGASKSPAAAASSAPAADEGPHSWTNGEEINWSRQIITTLIWLGLMCGGIVLIMRALYGRMAMSTFGGSKRNIQMLDRHMLGPQKAILLVQVPGKVLLLGMTEQQITMLTEISPDEMEIGGPTPAIRSPFGGRPAIDKPPGYDAAPDNLVDLAGLFGRRTQSNKGEDPE